MTPTDGFIGVDWQVEQKVAGVCLSQRVFDQLSGAYTALSVVAILAGTWVQLSDLVSVGRVTRLKNVVGHAAPAPHKPQVLGALFGVETFQHAPELLDELVTLFALFRLLLVIRDLFQQADIQSGQTAHPVLHKIDRYQRHDVEQASGEDLFDPILDPSHLLLHPLILVNIFPLPFLMDIIETLPHDKPPSLLSQIQRQRVT